ncbi:hypothetical protein GCM10027040_11000 [Halomonas shantousis]
MVRIDDARQLSEGEVAVLHEGTALDYAYVETEDEAFFEVTEEQAVEIARAFTEKRHPITVNGRNVVAVRQRPSRIGSP